MVAFGFAVVVVGWLPYADGRWRVGGKREVGVPVLLVGFPIVVCGWLTAVLGRRRSPFVVFVSPWAVYAVSEK